jgi:hypothetical protein
VPEAEELLAEGVVTAAEGEGAADDSTPIAMAGAGKRLAFTLELEAGGFAFKGETLFGTGGAGASAAAL